MKICKCRHFLFYFTYYIFTIIKFSTFFLIKRIYITCNTFFTI